MPGIAPCIDVLFWGWRDFKISVSSFFSRTGIHQGALNPSSRKFYGRYGDLIKKIWSSHLTNVKWHSIKWPYTLTTHCWSYLYQAVTLFPNLTFYRLMRSYHKTFATGVACRQGTLTHLDFAFVLLVETNPIPELVVFFSGICTSNITRYFLYFACLC